MNTSYSEIYGLFLRKVSDFDLPCKSDAELEDYCYGIMKSALIKIPSFDHNLEDINDELNEFNYQLSNIEIEVIACQMVVEWIDGKLNTSQLLHMFVGTKDESMASQANHISQLTALKDKQRSIVSSLIRDSKYRTWIQEG